MVYLHSARVDNISRACSPRAFVPNPSGAMEDARERARTRPRGSQGSGDVSVPIGDGPGRGLRTRRLRSRGLLAGGVKA